MKGVMDIKRLARLFVIEQRQRRGEREPCLRVLNALPSTHTRLVQTLGMAQLCPTSVYATNNEPLCLTSLCMSVSALAFRPDILPL